MERRSRNTHYLTLSLLVHCRMWNMARTFTGLKLQGLVGRFGRTPLSDIEGYVEFPDGKVLSGSDWGNMLLWEENLVKLQVRSQQTPGKCQLTQDKIGVVSSLSWVSGSCHAAEVRTRVKRSKFWSAAGDQATGQCHITKLKISVRSPNSMSVSDHQISCQCQIIKLHVNV